MKNKKKLYAVFSETLGVDLKRVDDDLAYDGVPEWDSVSHMALVAGLEESFEVIFEPEDIINLSSVIKTKEILLRHGVEFE